MKTIRVGAGSGYDVTVGSGILKNLGKDARSLAAAKNASKVVVVCDSNIADLYAEEAVMSLKLAGYTPVQFTVKPNGQSRRLNTVAELCSAAAAAGLRQGDFFVAIGGVTACDITGMAALLYLGGSPYISVPTTTLAQIMRSVGVAQNADLPEGRRMIATRWQPAAVLCDVDLLRTQSKRSVNNGIAEIIRLACVESEKLLDEIDSGDMERMIVKTINLRLKLAVLDEKTSGSRPMLHFGSLMCRAIEEVSDYSFDHGEALAVGMIITCAAAERAGIAQVGTTEKLETLLKKYGLPTTTNIPHEKLLEAIMKDKYATGTSFVLPVIKSIGDGYLHKLSTVDLKGFFIKSLPDWAK